MSNLTRELGRPQPSEGSQKNVWKVIQTIVVLMILSGMASAVRSCRSSESENPTLTVATPRENPSVTCDFASGREKRYCHLPRRECSREITFDPAEGKANDGKVLSYGPTEEGVVLHRWTNVYGGTVYQLCATGSHAVDAYYKLIPKPD